MIAFYFEGKKRSVSFVETIHVTDGVSCDVYRFDGDKAKDLAIIRINPGYKTPLQKVLKGEKTIEGYILGKGKFTITQIDGKQIVYPVGLGKKLPFSIAVELGEIMQWEADKDSNLIAYEICFPPYEDGRYENIG